LKKINRKEKGFDRNYFALLFEGASFLGAISIMAASGAVALFIDTMTGSVALVGLAISLQALTMRVGQLLGAPFVNMIRDLPKTLFVAMIFQRILPFLMAVPLFLGFGGYTAVWIFLVLFGLFWLWDGAITVPWSELTARALKPELRGHMMGMQVAIGGGLSLLTGLLLAWLLATPSLTDSLRFGYIFILTGAVVIVSIIFIRLVKDPSPIKVPEKANFKKYYSKLPAILRNNKPLQIAIIARLPGYIGFSVITFVIVFGTHTLEMTESEISLLVYSQIAGGLIGGVVLGETSRRFGNKTVILLCNAGVIVTLGMAIILTIFPALGYIWLISLCILASLWYHNWLGYINYTLDIAPKEHRPAYQVICNVIGIPFSFISYAIGAFIESRGYASAFIIGCIAASVTIIISTRLLSRRRIKELKI